MLLLRGQGDSWAVKIAFFVIRVSSVPQAVQASAKKMVTEVYDVEKFVLATGDSLVLTAEDAKVAKETSWPQSAQMNAGSSQIRRE